MADIVLRGAINRPGVGVEEGLGSRGVAGLPLGTAGFVGLLERGEIGVPIRCRTAEEFRAKCGGDLWDDFLAAFYGPLPTCVDGYFLASGNTGEAILVRVEGPAAVKAAYTFPSRLAAASGGGDALKIRAKTGGKWGGRLALSASPGSPTAVSATTLTVGAATWAVNQWAGASVTNVTRSTTHVVQSNTGTVLTFEADADLVITDGWLTADTYTIELLHNDRHLSAKVGPSDYGADFFELVLFVNGEQVRRYERVTMDPTSEFYVVDVLADDPANYYADAIDSWAAASKSYVANANPASYRAPTTALAATVVTDSAAVFPTVLTHGYSLAGQYVRKAASSTLYRIVSNTATALTVQDSIGTTAVDLTSAWGAHPQAYEVVAAVRCVGGVNDHSGVTIAQYENALTVGASAFDAVLDAGEVSMAVPGSSAFSAANRKTVVAAGFAYAEARGWHFIPEAPSDLSATAAKTLTNLLGDADEYFLTTSTNLGIDSIWGEIPASGWQRVRYPEHGNRVVTVPLIGDLLGVFARAAISSGGYIVPGAGTHRGSSPLPRAEAIDWDWEGSPVTAAMDRFSSRLNFFANVGGRFYYFGVRTPQATYPAWAFTTQRRQMSHIVASLLAAPALADLLFLPNNAANRGTAVGRIRAFLATEYEAGRLDTDLSFNDAARVYAGPENNTASIKAAGLMVIDVVLAFPYPAEKIRLRMSKAEAVLTLGG